MKVAIVGGGISGLTPLWASRPPCLAPESDRQLLHHFSEHEVEIFEKQDTFGGDAYTVPFQRGQSDVNMWKGLMAEPGKEPCWTDTAFLVFNRSGWPNFVRFLEHLRIPITRSADSLSVTHRSDGYSWGSTRLSALFCCVSNVLSWRTWSMVYDLLRLHYSALDVLRRPDAETAGLSVGQWLDREGYGQAIRDDYILPFVGALWSIPPDKVASEFPVSMFVRAFHNQRLLQLFRKDPYLSIAGGSRQYLDEIVSSIPPARLHSSTSIAAVRPHPCDPSRVDVVTSSGETRTYDHVILALHPHVVARICSPALVSDSLRDQLLSVEYTKFDVWMHYDESARPSNPRTWAAWNVCVEREGEADAEWVREQGITPSTVGNVTFDCNLLQGLDVPRYGSVLGTLNPTHRIDTAKVVAKRTYEMPVMSAKLRRLAGTINEINTAREKSQAGPTSSLLHPSVSIAGAWQDQGFHEDGFVSGFKVARRLGAQPPFELVDSHRPVAPPSVWDRAVVQVFVFVHWIGFVWASLAGLVTSWVQVMGGVVSMSWRWEARGARRLRRWSNSSVIKEKEA